LSEDFAAVKKKLIEIGSVNLEHLSWLFGLEEGGSTEALGRKILQANQRHSIVVIDQQEGSRGSQNTGVKSQHRSGNLQPLALLEKHLFAQDHFEMKR
jgi:hypothetical protein